MSIKRGIYNLHTKTQTSIAICMSIILSVLLVIGHEAIGEQTPVFPKTYEISKEDMERYQNIREYAIENALSSWSYRFILSVEEKAALWVQSNGGDFQCRVGIVDGLPTEDAISEEWAVYLAYAALEEKYGFDENILCFFHLNMIYDISIVDSPIWKVELIPYDLEEYGCYNIDIEAMTSIVLNCRGPEDAVG